MPWRKPWFDPAHSPHDALERRAYEVWISEIMLQQTRVSVVIDYWNRWMAQWPTIHDLAAADVDDVVLAWRGLGYYSRARRIHEAAGVVVGDADLGGLLPADPRELEARVPGVGRYTAGAISSIVFGRAVPMVDGNVLRVLSRQLGIYGNVKSDKAVIDVMWAAADALVKAAAADGHAGEDEDPETGRVSGVPGRWGQALMELGSTLCTPKPDCEACPISATCRAFNEGLDIARGPPKAGDNSRRKEGVDIEDLCGMCDTFEDVVTKEEEEEEEDSPRKRSLLDGKLTSTELSTAIAHARKFPRKVIKKPVREEETVVCAIRRADGRYLLHRRPEKGLLAGLWELPSQTLPSTGAGKAAARKAAAVKYLDGLRRSGHAGMADAVLRHAEDLGAIPWLFSHIKLTMHVHVFDATFADEEVGSCDPDGRWRWEESEVIDEESMGTGMRKCWALAKEAAGGTYE
ncbi:related to MYHalpha3 protein (DNA repair enzyme) [Cephalotrichum gorgonifer]|uniref:Adenine DNA glycosylase n=1 Tax=Cephalotrichum gorgonifer TaxID=2041049 RepID=A0AAE8N351_9PEZI|nr:related to MYHalpha3 protein (DNA repair enzyme) [Cephalotrichum gorgonifer]